MDESWRFRPLLGEICPICSVPHFPFCRPPLPSAGDNPRMHPPGIHPPFRHRALEEHVFANRFAPPHQPHHFPMPARDPFHSSQQQAFHEELLERESFRKRMRLDDGMMGSWTQSQIPGRYDIAASGRLPSADERILSLIRDHGQQRPQSNGYGYLTGSYAYGSPKNHLGSIRNDDHFRSSDFDYFGRNRPVGSPIANNLSHSGVPVSFQKPPSSAPDLLGFDRIASQEKNKVTGREWDSSSNECFSSLDVELGKVRNVVLDASAQSSLFYGYEKAGAESSEMHVVSYQHLEDEVVHKENVGQRPSHGLKQEAPKEAFYDKFNRYNDRQHSLSSGNNIAPCQPLHASFALDAESYKQRDCDQIHPLHYSRENKPQLHGHLGDLVAHHPSVGHRAPSFEDTHKQYGNQNHPSAENSRIPNSSNGSGHLATPTVNNVIPPMPGHINTMSNYPPLPSECLPSPPPEPSPLHLQQAIISPFMHQKTAKHHLEEGRSFSSKHSLPEKPTIIDASHIFKEPYRASRPGHIAIILRGLPGSGKSYLAKILRDLEVENGGCAPRIHSMDDYFMTEVEKVEDADGSMSSTTAKGKKHVTKKVMEYCYEPEMEEAYRASMLKAFKKTVEEGTFTFVIVDDRNLRVADFAQFWAIGKSSGYEVYLLEAAYKDPIGCAARNVHGFSSNDIQKMAERWEEAPTLYMQMNIQPLFNADAVDGHNILEVDMDMEDALSDEKDSSAVHEGMDLTSESTSEDLLRGGRWVAEEAATIKELGRSKWSKDSDEDFDGQNEDRDRSNALSGLIQAYSKSGKSVHWGDQVEKRGFSIGVAKRASISSLIIGPGCGYNLNSNPLPAEEADSDSTIRSKVSTTRKHSIFLEQLRAEQESFKAAFDKRRHRIGGLHDVDDE